MLIGEFAKLLETMIAEEGATILGKGHEYTRGQADRLASFKETASFAGVRPTQVAMIYLNKHYQSLAHYVATGETKSNEPIESRIMDLRVYMALMRALIQEERDGAALKVNTGVVKCQGCNIREAVQLLEHPDRLAERLCNECVAMDLHRQKDAARAEQFLESRDRVCGKQGAA